MVFINCNYFTKYVDSNKKPIKLRVSTMPVDTSSYIQQNDFIQRIHFYKTKKEAVNKIKYFKKLEAEWKVDL